MVISVILATILHIVQNKNEIYSSSGEEEQGDPVLQVNIMIDFFTLAVIMDSDYDLSFTYATILDYFRQYDLRFT